MRLLVVEDEPDLLSVLVRAARKEGYAVDSAADGEEGLYKAQSTNYDAIVLDMMLPRLDGWEVLTRLRKPRPRPCSFSPRATARRIACAGWTSAPTTIW